MWLLVRWVYRDGASWVYWMRSWIPKRHRPRNLQSRTLQWRPVLLIPTLCWLSTQLRRVWQCAHLLSVLRAFLSIATKDKLSYFLWSQWVDQLSHKYMSHMLTPLLKMLESVCLLWVWLALLASWWCLCSSMWVRKWSVSNKSGHSSHIFVS